MTLEVLYEALALPAACRVDRRVAKSLLVERGDLSSTDRRLAEAGIERLSWRATLNPGDVGLPAFVDETHEYEQVVVMAADLRPGAKPARLTEVIHRAVAHPLVLLVSEPEGTVMSVGLKRRHERESKRVVIERLVIAPPVLGAGDAIERAFMDSLALAALPSHDLWSLHTGWSERAEAFSAARITGAYRLVVDDEQAQIRRDALAAHSVGAREVSRLRKAAAAEPRLNRRIDLSRAVARAEAELAHVTGLLT